MTTTRKRPGKPLLLATIGLATLSYASAQGCGDDEPTGSGNLLPPPQDAGLDASKDSGPPILLDSGNLLAPPPQDAAADSALGDAALDAQLPSSGNLVPPPPDAGK